MDRLGQALLVVPLLVLLTPLRLVGLRLRELLLRQRSCLRVFACGMLAGGRSATCGHEADARVARTLMNISLRPLEDRDLDAI
jgi:hypothetical protein